MFAMGLGADARTTLLTAAALAPSLHNSQPWRFETGTTSVRVFADGERWLRAEDPRGCGLHLGLGAAVLNIRVAAAELGLLAHVTLLPDPRDPDHVATVDLAAGLGVDPELAALFPYLARRRTNRMPFTDRWVPERALGDLAAAAAADGAVLHVERDHRRVRRLLEIATQASEAERLDASLLDERARWVGGSRVADGVPSASLGPRPMDEPAPTRDLAARPEDRVRPPARFEHDPVLAVLSTARDDRPGWLGAGQALERVLLTAARWGLSASFLGQMVRTPELRWLVHDPADGPVHPQMVLRVGFADLPDPTPRRSLDDVAASGLPGSRSDEHHRLPARGGW